MPGQLNYVYFVLKKIRPECAPNIGISPRLSEYLIAFV